MRPALKQFGGHSNFLKYREWFRSIYSDRDEPLLDVIGRIVLFDQETLDDAAHVCYGGAIDHVYKPEYWREDRAQRIGWIGPTLEQPKRSHVARYDPRNQIYLGFMPPDDSGQENEWYCCIVRVIDRSRVSFLTAYNIDLKTYQEYRGNPERIWPPKSKNGKKRH